MMLQKMEQGLNKLLRDADFSTLCGKSVVFHVKRPKINVSLHFNNNHVHLYNYSIESPTTEIYTSVFQLIKMKISKPDARSFMSGDFYIKGDLQTARALDELFQKNKIDWEEQLSKCIGDVAAFNLGKIIKKGKKTTEEFASSLQHNVTEFIQEEIQLLPPAEAITDFLHELDDLTLRTERLQAKFNLLDSSDKK